MLQYEDYELTPEQRELATIRLHEQEIIKLRRQAMIAEIKLKALQHEQLIELHKIVEAELKKYRDATD